MFNFNKFYSDSEIQIAVDNLGDGQTITPKSLAEFLEDEVFEIESETTQTRYELPRKSRKSITADRMSRQMSRDKISSIVPKESINY